MKLLKIFFSLFILVFLAACSKPVINVFKVDNARPVSKKSGFYYCLPRTYIKVEVVVDKTEQIKGPYAEYAEKYLALTNVISSNSTVYQISQYKLSTCSEPDPGQFYFVEMPAGSVCDQDGLKIALAESGLLISARAFADTVIAEKPVAVFEEALNVYPDIFKSFTDLNLFEKVDTIIEKVSLDSGTIEKMTFKRSMVKKTPEQKAKEAADFIIKVKENRFNLISGFQEVNYDKETFRYMNEELQSLENEYRKLFTGISFTKKINYVFYYLPVSGRSADSVPLFRFSMLRGVLDTADSYGEKVFLSIRKSGNTQALEVYQQKKDSVKVKQHGYYYRLPDYAEVKLFDSKSLITSSKFLISQFGVLTSLPATIRRFDVHPVTGAVKNIEE